jgi:peroxiredoxin 2/4
LFFYPLDFTFVCPTELTKLSDMTADFEDNDAKVLGVSVDSVYSHQAWLKELGDFNYPLLSDITKRVSRDYNVLLDSEGVSLRGAFIIDPDGVLRAQVVNDLPVGRNIDEILRTLTAFQTGDLCPVGWTKGSETLGKA